MPGNYDYRIGQELYGRDYPFYGLVQALYRGADTKNAAKIEAAWPEEIAELKLRYNAPGGFLPSEGHLLQQWMQPEKD